MKGEACEGRRNDSYLSCLLGPERGKDRRKEWSLFPPSTQALFRDMGDTAGSSYGTHMAFTGRELPLLTHTRTQAGVGRKESKYVEHSLGSPPTVSMPWTRRAWPSSAWKELTLQEGGAGSSSGVRGKMGYRAEELICKDVLRYTDRHVFTDRCSMTCLVGSALCWVLEM